MKKLQLVRSHLACRRDAKLQWLHLQLISHLHRTYNNTISSSNTPIITCRYTHQPTHTARSPTKNHSAQPLPKPSTSFVRMMSSPMMSRYPYASSGPAWIFVTSCQSSRSSWKMPSPAARVCSSRTVCMSGVKTVDLPPKTLRRLRTSALTR